MESAHSDTDHICGEPVDGEPCTRADFKSVQALAMHKFRAHGIRSNGRTRRPPELREVVKDPEAPLTVVWSIELDDHDDLVLRARAFLEGYESADALVSEIIAETIAGWSKIPAVREVVKFTVDYRSRKAK